MSAHASTKHRLSFDPADPDFAQTKLMIAAIREVLRDHESSRLVLNACDTNSRNLKLPDLEECDDPATEILQAIAAQPNLVDQLRASLQGHRTQLVAAITEIVNPQLLNEHGQIDLIYEQDPASTGSKLGYLTAGKKPATVMSLALELWASQDADVMVALSERKRSGGWDSILSYALAQVVIANQDNAALIQQLIVTADKLGSWEDDMEGPLATELAETVPFDARAALFAALSTCRIPNHVALAMFQLWAPEAPDCIARFWNFLTEEELCVADLKDRLELEYIDKIAGALMPPPEGDEDPPEGPLLLALACLAQWGAAAPGAAKAFIRTIWAEANEFQRDEQIVRLAGDDSAANNLLYTAASTGAVNNNHNEDEDGGSERKRERDDEDASGEDDNRDEQRRRMTGPDSPPKE